MTSGGSITGNDPAYDDRVVVRCIKIVAMRRHAAGGGRFRKAA
jgi:hypothetical protein